MRNFAKVIVAAGLCFSVAACGGLGGSAVTAVANLVGLGGAVNTLNTVVSGTATTIGDICTSYKGVEGSVNSVADTLPQSVQGDIQTVESYGDAACANPPAGNVASTALWFGQLVDQLKTLGATKSSAPTN